MKDPIKVGDLYESIPRGKAWEVIGTGVRADWTLCGVTGGVRRIECDSDDLNDPHRWRPFNLDELPVEQRGHTIQGKRAGR